GVAVAGAALAPAQRTIGAEPAGAPSMRAALEAGEPVALASIDTFVDGAAVRRVGAHTFPLVQALVDEVVTVPEGAVCTTMLELYQRDGIIAEPAGALAVTAVTGAVGVVPGATVVCVVSGGNNDVSRYGEVVERSLLHEGLKHYFLVEFPQEPGALRGFLDRVLGPTDDITLFEYVKKNNREVGPALVGIELATTSDLDPLLERMDASGLHIERLSAGSPAFRFLV
ncbi:MAG: pyridoxal-phosphate dependent enzyme, partial [Actinomycetota bacterium]|nr:pyridoxal-phosphate dependent enzyme [Actinomycetota bacterium]